jgi:hypothetical protein
MTSPRRLAVLFLSALLGLAVVGALVAAMLGPWVLAAYLVVEVAGLVVLAKRARTVRAAFHRAQGRTCTCCTSTVFDPVEIR